jgi:putative phage-type endonuclease
MSLTEAEIEKKRESIGSSDVGILTGAQDYGTKRSLYYDKKGLSKPRPSNYAMDMGNKYEPIARAIYELNTGLSFSPVNIQSKNHPLLVANLDGFNEENKIVLEIKCAGKEVMDLAKKGIVHPKYVDQLEHQLECADSNESHFMVCTVDEKRGGIVDTAVVIYKSNPERKALMIKEASDFWFNYVLTNTPPPLTDADEIERTDEKSVSLFSQMKVLKDILARHEDLAKETEKQINEIKEEIIKNMTHTCEVCEGIRIRKSKRRGAIDTTKIGNDGVDIEKYRKPDTEYYTITLV